MAEDALDAAMRADKRFLAFARFVLLRETAYDRQGRVMTEHVPGDAGGTTRFGIDQRSHPNIDIGRLTEWDAQRIYYKGDWLPVMAGHLPLGLGELVSDIHITGGYGVLWLQECLNDYGGKLLVDGYIGPKTVRLANGLPLEDRKGVLNCMLDKRNHYFTVCAQVGSNFRFLRGWLNRDDEFADWVAKTSGGSSGEAVS